ncbi:hypothetical protein BGW36DRAFT_378091 [Talaromyces proteolyticus]|uniref:SnoaL-like domain-containing protein n=1 Tax=Talaromyces proteolyticus TaxID=1131652 RepID=A0AAD4KNY7_9EURO|nr:uncharacterized protein BGW36DRAFT_378091 [Talaromyces proteolyticus]KAH8697163.1 hypothetical protein BGW36DRAFT_378091 [Talaromyces proteolyticus]
MSSFIIDGRLTPINPSSLNDVTSEERSSAIDFVNRHNFIFQEFNHDKMIATFLPDAVVYHSKGTIHGHAEFRAFFENLYGAYIPGISRSATNHIVDRDGDGGVVVRYQQYLIRYGWAGDDAKTVAGKNFVRDDGLPSIWWFAPIIDRLRMTADGWKFFERYLGPSFTNQRLDPPKASKV